MSALRLLVECALLVVVDVGRFQLPWFHIRTRDEDGAVIATVAVSMVAILALAAFAIDLGIAFVERREARNGSDHAALAAAWAHCNEDDSVYPNTAAAASILRNGYATSNLTLAQTDWFEYRADVATGIPTRESRCCSRESNEPPARTLVVLGFLGSSDAFRRLCATTTSHGPRYRVDSTSIPSHPVPPLPIQ